MKNSHNFFLGLAKEVSKASYCKRAQVGAIIVKDGNIISFGYNGTPKGFDNNCEECNNTTKNDVLHAESNAITKCAKSCYSSEGAILYCTMSPCFDCSKLIIQSGIQQVYFIEAYRNLDGIDLLKKANIYVEQIVL